MMDAQEAIERWDELTDRERDAAVAVAKGYEVREVEDPDWIEKHGPFCLIDDEGRSHPVPRFTTDIAAAWPLVEDKAWPWQWVIAKDVDGVTDEFDECIIVDDQRREHVLRADTGPEAISKAYVMANG